MVNWRRCSRPVLLFVLLFLVSCVTGTTDVSQSVALPPPSPSATSIKPQPTPDITATKPKPVKVEVATENGNETATPTRPEPTETARPSKTPLPPTLTPVPCRIAGRVLYGTFPSEVAFGEYDYSIYLPPCYGRDQRVYPTLYLFGGNTHDEAYWDTAGLDELAEAAIMAGEMPPFLIVMPDGDWVANNSSGGSGSYEGLVLNDLIPFIEQEYCAWGEPAGRAIGGLSRGGYWSLEIAFRHPEQFISAAGHSPALIDSFAGPDENPNFTALNNDLGDLRIWLDIGDNDWLLPNTLQLHEDMAAAGIPHEWHLNEGAHEDSYWPAHFAEYLAWYAAPWPLDRTPYPSCTP